MIFKFSDFTSPIKDTIKSLAGHAEALEDINQDYGKEAFKKLTLKKKQNTYRDLIEKVVTPRSETADRWERYLSRIGTIQGIAFLIVIAVGYVSLEKSKTLTTKKVIPLGPCLRLSFGILPTLEMSKQITKFIHVYYKKQASDAKSRKEYFLQEIILSPELSK